MKQIQIAAALILPTLCFLAGCMAVPPELSIKTASVHQICRLAPNKWRQIPPPLSRKALLDLSGPISKKPIGTFFSVSDGLNEIWFESNSGDRIQLCQFDPERYCYEGGILRYITFMKVETSWQAASEPMQVFCSE